MKRLISLFVMVAMITMAYSQSTPNTDQTKLKESREAVFISSNDVVVKMPVKEQSGPRAMIPDEDVIGTTWYDLQTNKSVQNRIYRWEDGTMGAVWTMGMEASNFPDRGAGYNFFNGTEWGPQPTTRIESVRTGWPSYSPLGANGELIISHDFGAHELYLNQRETKGEGDWVESTYVYSGGPPNLSWPRHITSGTDNMNIHLTSNTFDEYLGMTSAQVYSRSTDGGETWDIQNVIIDGMGVDDYLDLAADEVIWADPVGETIAFLVMGIWHDMFIMKSTDNGDNWDKVMVWEHPYPFFDWNTTITDTFFCMDRSATIALDMAGKAHVAFGISRVGHFEVGETFTYYPYVEGIGYWNEDMEPFSNDLDALAPPQYGYANSEMILDYNYIGWMQDVDGDGEVTLTDDIMSYRSLGPCTMPAIHVDFDGNIFVLFAATTETYFNDTYNYKHIWARGWNAWSGAWEDFFVDLTSDIVHIFDECIYPQLASSSDDNIYYLYNADLTPGLALDEDHAYEENREIAANIYKGDIIIMSGVDDLSPDKSVSVSQNYPNPASTSTSFTVTLDEIADVSIEVINITGQVVMIQNEGIINPGSKKVTIDVSSLTAGTYFYTVKAGNETVTNRMMIN